MAAWAYSSHTTEGSGTRPSQLPAFPGKTDANKVNTLYNFHASDAFSIDAAVPQVHDSGLWETPLLFDRNILTIGGACGSEFMVGDDGRVSQPSTCALEMLPRVTILRIPARSTFSPEMMIICELTPFPSQSIRAQPM